MLKKIITYIIPINLLFDILLAFFSQGGVVPIIRALFMLSLLIFFILKFTHNNRYYSVSIFFSIYILITCLFSTDILRSLSITLKVVISILSVGIGLGFFNSFERLKSLNNSMIIVLIMVVLNFVISTVFGIGIDKYTGDNDFLAGNLDDSWNVFTYSILISPLILLQYSKLRYFKFFLFVLLFINSIILLLSLKRIAIVGLLFGLVIYTLFNFKVAKTFRNTFFILLILTLSFPLYEDQLFKRFEAREDRFQSNSLESEARYAETFYVWDETLSFRKPMKSIFGLQGFNSVGNYAEGKFGDRNLHVDYNLIVNTIGIVGLILYFSLFAQFFLCFLKFKNVKHNIPIKFYNVLVGLFFTLLITQFLTSFAGQMYSITFRMIIFIYLGAIIGIMKRYSKDVKKEVINPN